MTIQKKILDLTGSQYLVQKVKSAISDVDSSLSTHIADTDIHVTTADKTKWDTIALVKQLRLVNTQVGSATTIAFANIDDTNGIKVGDKCMDLDAKMFEITAVDTTNQTVTVGSALIDLALDANVVHTSGNETISGDKTFNNGARIYKSNSSESTPSFVLRTSKVSRGSTTDGGDSQAVMFNDRGDSLLSSVRCTKVSNGTTQLRNTVNTTDTSDNLITCETQLNIAKNGDKSFIPSEDSQINLGSSSFRWKSFNGLTPSSLGMPSDRSARVDISGYFTNTANGDTNTYTVPANGWIYLNLNDVVVAHCFAQTAGNLSHYGQTFARASAGQLHCLFPVRKDDVFVSQWYTTTTVTVTNAYFILCQGDI